MGPALPQLVDVGELIKFMCVYAKEGGGFLCIVTFIGLPWVTVELSPASAVWEFVAAALLPISALRSFEERS